MDVNTCKLLAQYNQLANQKMDNIIRNLSDTQWNREFTGYFKTIMQLCSHIYVGDYGWLKRFGKFRDFQFIKDSLFDQNLIYSSKPFNDIAGYISKRDELDNKLIMLTNEITESDLGKIITFANSKGEMINKNVGGSFLHMFNHETHHRGMVSIY